MVNRSLHRTALIDILSAIYSERKLLSVLGFKGGTAAMLFFNLPRFSVDLDFDLLAPEKKDEVFQIFKELLPRFGKLLEAREKQHTLFFLLSYKKGERMLKIDLSKRPLRHEYVPEALEKAVELVEKGEKNQILAGLGELLESEKQKAFVKDKLQGELVFSLKLYLSNITGKNVE